MTFYFGSALNSQESFYTFYQSNNKLFKTIQFLSKMVRYGQFSKLPCDPNPEQNRLYEEEYKQVKGILSIKTLTKKIQPLFEHHLKQTAQIYSLIAHGTHAHLIFEQNKLTHAKQSESIDQLRNLSDYLIHKTDQFEQLERKLIQNLQNEFNEFLRQIHSTIHSIQRQYREILEEQFKALKKETSEQIHRIMTDLNRLQKQFERQLLVKRNLTQKQIIEIAGTSTNQIHGYESLFKIVSNQTLRELQRQLTTQENHDQELVIDTQKIKSLSCHELWCLIELASIKNNSQKQVVQNNFASRQPDRHKKNFETKIKRQEVLIKTEQDAFKTQTIIIQQLIKRICKNEKKPKSQSTNQGIIEELKTLTDFIKEKPMKTLIKSIESHIQKQFVNFNIQFSYQNRQNQLKEKAGILHSPLIAQKEEAIEQPTIVKKEQIIQSPLIAQREQSTLNEQQSELHYQDESVTEQRKKQAQKQFNDYRQKMRMKSAIQSDNLNQQENSQTKKNEKNIHKAYNQQEQAYEAYQRKLDRQQNPHFQPEKLQSEKYTKKDFYQQNKYTRKDSYEQEKYTKRKDSYEQEKYTKRKDSYEQEKYTKRKDSYEQELERLKEFQMQRQRQLQIERQIIQQSQIQQQRRIQKQIQAQKLKSLFNPTASIQKKKSHQRPPQQIYRPEFIKKDFNNSRILQQWKQDRRKSEYQQQISQMREKNPMDEEQDPQEASPFANLTDEQMQEQIKIMTMYQMQNQGKYSKQENPMMKRFKQQVQHPYQKKKISKQQQPQGQQFDFEDYRKNKISEDSLLQFVINESMIGCRPQDLQKQPFKQQIQSIKPLSKPIINPLFANPFSNPFSNPFAIPSIRTMSERQPQSIDTSLAQIQELLLGMIQMKASFSLTNLIYNSKDYDNQEEQIFFDQTDRQMLIPITGQTKGHLQIKQILNTAEQLNSSKQAFSIVVKVIQPVLLTFKTRDRKGNRPMTKLIVGDSTGIGILYMNYYCQVIAGCCLRLDNCRLNKFSQSYEINHHKSITFSNILPGAQIPRISSQFTLSTIRKVDHDRFEYDIKSHLNPRLIDCIGELKRSRITIGEIQLPKPIIISVCEVSRNRECIIGDYTGRIAADFSNMKKDVTINKNDTLLLRRAKLQINRGTVVLVADLTTFLIKADMEFKFSHDMKFIPDKILKGATV